jgi:hypothetical protein
MSMHFVYATNAMVYIWIFKQPEGQDLIKQIK